MKKQTLNEIVIFAAFIAIVVLTFGGGLMYLAAQNKTNNATAVADAISTSSLSTTILNPSSTITVTSTIFGAPTSVIKKPTSSFTPTHTPAVIPPSKPTPSDSIIPPAASEASIPSTTQQTEISLPYSIGTFGIQSGKTDGWTRWFGDFSETGGVLTINSNSGTTSGGALLEGSNNWTDYTFNAKVDWIYGEKFVLVGRYVDADNFLSCEFSQQSAGTVTVMLNQRINGGVVTLAHGLLQNYNQLGGYDISATFQAVGNQASCGFNYHSISSATAGTHVDPALAKGGIGFVSHDPLQGNSKIDVKAIGVVAGTYYLGPDTIQGQSTYDQTTNQ